VSENLVQVTVDEGVATVELNRPQRANCMDGPMFAAISSALDAVKAMPEVKSVVLCGAGRHFCAGGDLDHPLFSDDDRASRRRQIEDSYEVTSRLLDLPLPVVTAVQGRCAGAGLALVLGSDIRVASRSAVFSLDFVRLGLVPDMGVCYLLASSMGTGRALDLALTGELAPAERLFEWGVISRLVDDGDERAAAMRVARQLAKHPPAGMARIRSLVRTASYLDRREAFELEVSTMTELTASDDARAQLQAFRERARAAAG
jgi:2-(1,2-epoxy-1,2-dihydrophenyl)acetyl-CoA isomerase